VELLDRRRLSAESLQRRDRQHLLRARADEPTLPCALNIGSLPDGLVIADGVTLVAIEAYGNDWETKLLRVERLTPAPIWLMPRAFTDAGDATDAEAAARLRDEYAYAQTDPRITGLYWFLVLLRRRRHREQGVLHGERAAAAVDARGACRSDRTNHRRRRAMNDAPHPSIHPDAEHGNMQRDGRDVWPADVAIGTFDIEPCKPQGYPGRRHTSCSSVQMVGVAACSSVPDHVDRPTADALCIWKWDGNLERPSITPSINCLSEKDGKPAGGRGWHGYITEGIIR
jgi:hypothetical protein